MKFFNIVTDRLAQKFAALVVMLPLAIGAAGGIAAAGPDESGAQGRRFQSLDEAIAAGALDSEVASKLQQHGQANALVSLDQEPLLKAVEAAAPKGEGREQAMIRAMKPGLAAQKVRVLGPHKGEAQVLQDYENFAASFVKFHSAGSLLAVLNNYETVVVTAPQAFEPLTTQSLSLIQQPLAAAAGFTGAGYNVAVLDSGVDYTRAEFGGCTAPNVPSTCRVFSSVDTAVDDRLRDSAGDKFHGTNVSGIVLGVAPGARIFAYDVMPSDEVGDTVLAALDRVITAKGQTGEGAKIVAVNLSLGVPGTAYWDDCTIIRKSDGTSFTNPYTGKFTSLRGLAIIPVVASGNDGFKTGISYPACTPGALSVGAVHDSAYGQFPNTLPLGYTGCIDPVTAADQVACFSNSGAALDMYAPGAYISAAGVRLAGTSQAAPHVAGALAVLKAKEPGASMNTVEDVLRQNGPLVSDRRDPNRVITRHRLDVNAAARALDGTPPTITAPTQRLPVGSTLNSCWGTPADGIPTLIEWLATDPSGIYLYWVERYAAGGWTNVTLPHRTSRSIAPRLEPNASQQYRVFAIDQEGNRSVWATGSMFTPRLSQESAATYTGAWGGSSGECGLTSGKGDFWSNTAGASASFTFTGRSVAWVASQSATAGRARVYVDGTCIQIVDLYSSTQKFRTVVFAKDGLSPATHTMRIEVEGTAGRPSVNVDAFVVLQ